MERVRTVSHDDFFNNPNCLTCCFLFRRHKEEKEFRRRDVYNTDLGWHQSDGQETKSTLRKTRSSRSSTNVKVGNRQEDGFFDQERIQTIKHLHFIMTQRWNRLNPPSRTSALSVPPSTNRPTNSTTTPTKTGNGEVSRLKQHSVTKNKSLPPINSKLGTISTSSSTSNSHHNSKMRNNKPLPKRASAGCPTSKATGTPIKNALLKRKH